jgi:hypothetical protein
MYQSAIKYANFFHYIQDPPKFTQNGIFGLKICHLATLVATWIFLTDFKIGKKVLICAMVWRGGGCEIARGSAIGSN